jgi:hypothetical protein
MQSEKEKGSQFSELSDAAVKELYVREGIQSHSPVICHAVLTLLEIRNHILAGHVDQATSLIDKHYPDVLSVASSPTESMDLDTSRSEAETDSETEYFFVKSSEPLHLLLNLRILSFIEACRTVPLEYPPQPSDPTNMDVDSSTSKKRNSDHLELDGPSLEQRQNELIISAQKLSQLANTLPPANRASYQKEMDNVLGLLAYRTPEKSSMAKYLSQARREAVADQVNAAILRKCNWASVFARKLTGLQIVRASNQCPD